ncbi:MAG: phage portal protein family protein, partial [Candidatus Hodarchaeales archaeon]
WAPRHPTTLFRWEFDENNGLAGLWQQGPPNYKTVFIPIEKLLHFSTTGLGKGNPEGQSVLEGAYKSFWEAKGLNLIEAITIERMSGTPVMTLPEGADVSEDSDSDLERAKKIARNVKTAEDMGVTLPHGFEFRYETPSSGPAIDIGAAVMRRQRDMARVLMMDFIMLGGGDQGSWAMHKDKSQLFIRTINAFLRSIAAVINRHAIPRLFAINVFPGISGLPQVFFNRVTKIDIGDYSEVVARLFNAGATTWDIESENAIRREIGLPEITEPGIVYKTPFVVTDTKEPGDEKGTEDKSEEEKGDETEEETDEDKEEGTEEFAETLSRMGHQEAIDRTDRAARLILRDYDAFSRDLAEQLAEEDDENLWGEIVIAALAAFALSVRARLRRGMLTIWDKTTDNDPSVEGLRAILTELEFQNQFLENSLVPNVRDKILSEMTRLKDKGTSKVNIALAIMGILAGFRFRAKQYSAGIFKIYENFANPTRIFNLIKPIADKAGEEISRDWNSGQIRGANVLARYEGPDDERSCQPCHEVIQQGWILASRIPPIGSLACQSNCRHHIAFKYRGRTYR